MQSGVVRASVCEHACLRACLNELVRTVHEVAGVCVRVRISFSFAEIPSANHHNAHLT